MTRLWATQFTVLFKSAEQQTQHKPRKQDLCAWHHDAWSFLMDLNGEVRTKVTSKWRTHSLTSPQRKLLPVTALFWGHLETRRGVGGGAGEGWKRMEFVSQSDTLQWEGDKLNTCGRMFRKAECVLNRKLKQTLADLWLRNDSQYVFDSVFASVSQVASSWWRLTQKNTEQYIHLLLLVVSNRKFVLKKPENKLQTY